MVTNAPVRPAPESVNSISPGLLPAQVKARQDTFLLAFAKTGNTSESCRQANVSRAVLYNEWLKQKEFTERYHDAEGAYIDYYVSKCDERALEGWNGHPPSDLLMMFRLKKLDPSYRDNQGNISINDGKPLVLHVVYELPGTSSKAQVQIEAPAVEAQVKELETAVQEAGQAEGTETAIEPDSTSSP